VDDRRIDYRILGSFEVRVGDRLVGLGGEKPRALLAILLLHRNEVVSVDRLVDDLWGESPPETALRTVRAYVSRLRKALRANGTRAAEEASAPGANGASPAEEADCVPDANGGLLTQGRGYVLRVAPGEVDLERFAEMAERGRDALAAGRPEEAATVLRSALGIWRGPPLADFAYEPFAQSSIAQFEELHLAAVEDRVEADLARGLARELVGELRDLVARHSLRERLRGQLMLALYRSGRQAEALEAYQQFRRTLSEELGLDPGPPTQRLELAILARDPTLDLSPRVRGSAALPAAAPAGVDRLAPVRPRRLRLAVGAALLLALAVVGAIVAVSGGGTAAPTGIPGNSVGAISESGGALRAVVPLGTSPSVLAGGNGAVWAANYNQGTVSRIDVATRATVQTIEAGTTPAGLAVGGGSVWVTNNYGGTVSRIDPAVDRVVQTIPVGNAPTGAAVGYGSVWVANSSDGTLTRIDGVSGTVKRTIALGSNATDVAPGAGAVWVSDRAGDRVFRVDPHADQVTGVINVGAGPTAIAGGFGSVWVANSLDGTISRIDPQTDAVTATIPVGDGAGAIAVGAGAVWITSQYAGTVSAIDPAANVVKRTITVGTRPQALAFSNGLVWIGTGTAAASHRGGTLTVLTTGRADTFDPVLTQDLYPILPLTYDGLTTYQRVGGSGSVQLVPDLAISLPSPTDGGTTYTFRLRRGVRYSNGEPLRPEDFRRALERELILGGNTNYGGLFADVIGGAACAAHPRHCDLSRGVVVDDDANTVTFHLVAPNPEFLNRLTLPDAYAVPAGTPDHDVGLHPMPATGAYEWVDIAPRDHVRLVRNPYFHEWSNAARPDGYPDQIVFKRVSSGEAGLTAVERGRADYLFDGVPQDRLTEAQTQFAGQVQVTPTSGTTALILNTRTRPFTDVRVRRAVNFAVDRGKVAALLGQGSQPACQTLLIGLPGYRRYCPYTTTPDATGIWHGPDLARAERLVAASGTRGTPIIIWDLWDQRLAPADHYIASLLDRLGYPTRVKDFSGADPTGDPQFADSRTGAQAALYAIPIGLPYPSASQVLHADFACQSFVPRSAVNSNWSEFCDHRLDAQIDGALTAEASNAPDTAALWAEADRTATNQAPAIPLTTNTDIHLVSARVGNYQYSFAQGVLLDQFWVR
jgi:YVTN family beta-propeller protein